MLKISGVYLIGNPEICQDPPSCGQDDQTLLISDLMDYQTQKKDVTMKYFLTRYTTRRVVLITSSPIHHMELLVTHMELLSLLKI